MEAPLLEADLPLGEDRSRDLFLDPVHLNAAGNRRLAEIQADFLLRSGLLPG